MAQPIPLATVNGTPRRIASGAVRQIQTIFAHNPSETTGAYVKLYNLAGSTPPDLNTPPSAAFWVGPGATGSGGHSETIPAFCDGGNWWINVATQFGAGVTNPATEFNLTVTVAP